MPSLDREVRNIQNPAFGATLLAGFVQGFYAADLSKQGAPLPYLYLVLPMILNADIYRVLRGTKPSLRHFAEKLISLEYAGTDLLLSISTRAKHNRKLTDESLAVLLAAGLAALNTHNGRLVPRKVERFAERPELTEEAEEAGKLGNWFAELSPFEVGSILKVTF